MFDLKFTYNWNKKLDCTAFTTIRIYNPQKHIQGERVNLLLKEKPIGLGVVKNVFPFYLHELTELIAYLDTGYNLQTTRDIIHKMYSKVDFTTQKIALLLIVKDKKKPRLSKPGRNIGAIENSLSFLSKAR